MSHHLLMTLKQWVLVIHIRLKNSENKAHKHCKPLTDAYLGPKENTDRIYNIIKKLKKINLKS